MTTESELARFSAKASPLKTVLAAAAVVVSVVAAVFLYLRKKRLH